MTGFAAVSLIGRGWAARGVRGGRVVTLTGVPVVTGILNMFVHSFPAV